jgi:hypothetical protein
MQDLSFKIKCMNNKKIYVLRRNCLMISYVVGEDYIENGKVKGYAFCDDKKNRMIIIPDNVDGIEIGAFKDSFIKKVLFSPKLEKIGCNAFFRCKKLTQNLIFPETVKIIDSQSFFDCENILGVIFGGNLDTIGDGAFYGCKNLCGTLLIPDKVREMGSSAFADCNFSKVILGKQIKSIKEATFQCNSNLKEIILNDGIEQIGSRAFQECSSLEHVVIPDTCNDIGRYAFSECYNLRTITWRGKVYDVDKNGKSQLNKVFGRKVWLN